MTLLRGKRIVITGASSGIGRELARLMARRGGLLAVCARRGDRLQSLADEIEAEGWPRPLTAVCDVRDPAQVAAMRDEVESRMGPAEVLVNNAGRGAFRPFVELSPQEASDLVATNLTGVIHCTRAFLPAMLARGSGHLVFISSVLGELPAPEHAVYGATKFAVSGLAESLDYELRSQGIKVTLVEPGLVMSEFVEVSGTPLRRFDQLPHQTAEQVAVAIVRAIERGQQRCVADPLAWIAIDFRRHFPRLARLLFGVAIRRAYRRDRGSSEG